MCKSLLVPEIEDNYLRFLSDLLDQSKEFELDDPTEEFDNYDKRKGKADKVIIVEGDDFEEELETSQYDIDI